MPLQTLNDYLSFATHLLQPRASKSYMFDMTTKLVIYGIMDLRISSSKHKSTLFIGVFYSHILAWLPKVTDKTCLGMKLNLQMFLKGPKEGKCCLVKEKNPKVM